MFFQLGGRQKLHHHQKFYFSALAILFSSATCHPHFLLSVTGFVPISIPSTFWHERWKEENHHEAARIIGHRKTRRSRRVMTDRPRSTRSRPTTTGSKLFTQSNAADRNSNNKGYNDENNEDVSERCFEAMKPSSAYADAFREATKYPYDALTRPDGYVILSVAENKLSIDLLVPKLHEMETVQAAFPPSNNPTVYGYNTFAGLPYARKVGASFIGKRFLLSQHEGNNRSDDDDDAATTTETIKEGDESVGGVTSSSSRTVDPRHIGIGSGAAGILHSLFYLLGNKANNDCCLIPTPFYAAFENQMKLVAGIEPFGFQVENPVLGPTPKELEDAYQNASSVVADIVAWARQYKIHTVCDEVYALSTHQKLDHGFQSIIKTLHNELEDNVHWLWSVSKDFGASGWRFAFLYSQNETLMKAFENLNGFSCVSQPIQMVVSKLLSDEAFVDSYLDQSRGRLLRNYNICTTKLTDLDIPFVNAKAGLFVYADFSSLLPDRNMEWERKLSTFIVNNAKVLLTPGENQRDHRPGMFRICYAWVGPEELEVGMIRLGRIIKQIQESSLADLY